MRHRIGCFLAFLESKLPLIAIVCTILSTIIAILTLFKPSSPAPIATIQIDNKISAPIQKQPKAFSDIYKSGWQNIEILSIPVFVSLFFYRTLEDPLINIKLCFSLSIDKDPILFYLGNPKKEWEQTLAPISRSKDFVVPIIDIGCFYKGVLSCTILVEEPSGSGCYKVIAKTQYTIDNSGDVRYNPKFTASK
jgi:hypothetical protein